LQFWVAAASYAYLFLMVVVWATLDLAGERWWVATLLLFGPRWVFGLPLIALAPAAVIIHRRSMWVIGVATVLLLFPIMNVCLPWRLVFSRPPAGPHLRILTCNRHRYALTTSAMAQFIDATKPDIVVMQEWTSHDEQELFGVGGWHIERDGELFLASRFPIRSAEDIVQGAWGPAGAAVCYQIDLGSGSVHLINLHLASPHMQFADAIHGSPDGPEEIDANSAMRLDQSIMIANYAESVGGPILLAGDFNTPGDSSIFEKAWVGFTDAFSYAGCGVGNTFHTRWSSSRIDHILAAGRWQFSACWVGADLGSPHRPLVADIAFP